MITKKTIVYICLSCAVIFHFIFFFGTYGPKIPARISNWNSLLALTSIGFLILLYLGSKWRSQTKHTNIVRLYDLLIVWIFVCYIRSMLTHTGGIEMQELLFNPYIGLALFPTLFFVIGINIDFFSTVNRLFSLYCFLAFAFTLIFIKHSELQLFILLPIFYIVITYPLQVPRNRLLTIIIAIVIIITSFSNRSGVLRILISYVTLVVYYLILKFKINQKIVNLTACCLLLLPFYFIYLGVSGENIFQIVGKHKIEYSQEDLTIDTRTFLYNEVFSDLEMNNAFKFGKGINGGYASEVFETLNRNIVEVGFLQILLKSGIVGFVLYMSIIFSAIFLGLAKSQNNFMKLLALILVGYVLMFFIENTLAFDLLNISTWFIVGMCHSDKLRALNDQEIKILFLNGLITEHETLSAA
jgi:hypothetical protein